VTHPPLKYFWAQLSANELVASSISSRILRLFSTTSSSTFCVRSWSVKISLDFSTKYSRNFPYPWLLQIVQNLSVQLYHFYQVFGVEHIDGNDSGLFLKSSHIFRQLLYRRRRQFYRTSEAKNLGKLKAMYFFHSPPVFTGSHSRTIHDMLTMYTNTQQTNKLEFLFMLAYSYCTTLNIIILYTPYFANHWSKTSKQAF